jgi:hypothetical protein
MTSTLSTTTTFGEDEVYLRVEYDYTKGSHARFSDIDGGQPAEGPEIDIFWMEWAERKTSGGSKMTINPDYMAGKIEGGTPYMPNQAYREFPGPWSTIECGPLFDLIAAQDWLREEIIAQEESE